MSILFVSSEPGNGVALKVPSNVTSGLVSHAQIIDRYRAADGLTSDRHLVELIPR